MSVPVLSETRQFGRFLEYTREHMMPGILSVAIDSQPAISIFTGRIANAMYPERGPQGSAKRTATGESIVIKTRLGINSTATELSGGYADFDTTPQDNVRHGRANWKLYGATVNLSGHEIDVNSGPEAVANMVEEESRDAVESLLDVMGGHVYTNSGFATRLTGLDQLISANDTVHGLSGPTYPPWNSRGVSPDGTVPASITFTPGTPSFAAAGLANMRTAWNQASEGATTEPNVVLTGLVNHERYEGSLEPQHRITNMMLADAGIRALEFKKAPVIPDRKATAGAMYFINTNLLYLMVLAGADFQTTPWTAPEKQRVQVMKFYVTCELVIRDRKRNNKLTGITA